MIVRFFTIQSGKGALYTETWRLSSPEASWRPLRGNLGCKSRVGGQAWGFQRAQAEPLLGLLTPGMSVELLRGLGRLLDAADIGNLSPLEKKGLPGGRRLQDFNLPYVLSSVRRGFQCTWLGPQKSSGHPKTSRLGIGSYPNGIIG